MPSNIAVVGSKLISPPSVAVASPSSAPPLYINTLAPASAVPVSNGVLSLVGVVTLNTGTPGSTVSTTSDNATLAVLVFSAASVAVAVNEYVPSANATPGVNV